jgi:RNA polymerase sigma-54 factor
MGSLKHNLSLRVSQRQILTPGLVQMVSVLALNKLELKDMINAEIVENPVLEELEDSVPLLDQATGRDEDAVAAAAAAETVPEKKDPFDEIDFGSYFQDYLDPGYKSRAEMEEIERPSFEAFLSKAPNLTDHLMWQLGSLSLSPPVREAAETVVGNLNEDGYLLGTDEELLGLEQASFEIIPEEKVRGGSKAALGNPALANPELAGVDLVIPGLADAEGGVMPDLAASSAFDYLSNYSAQTSLEKAVLADAIFPGVLVPAIDIHSSLGAATAPAQQVAAANGAAPAKVPFQHKFRVNFSREQLYEAITVVQQLDPPGVGARDLRECLLAQIHALQQIRGQHKDEDFAAHAQLLTDAENVVDQHLHAMQLKNYKEIARALARPAEAITQVLELIKTLDPRPGLRYNAVNARLIEPDVAFVKQGDEWLVMFNDDDVPQLRLNPGYKKLMNRDEAERDVRNYVKERYKSAIQLIKNIEQRKQTILKVCLSILERQHEFLDLGIDMLKPMMIKEVAEEIGVHPSTVSRAVANKYVHTPQGVFELRYFFSESVQGPEGGGTSLLILKRRVKKLIEDEDPAKPLTDDQITAILQGQGIQVTRRTVAKYREDMKIPSTHQRRVKKK